MLRAASILLLCLTLEDVVSQLGEPDVIRGNYSQSREISLLSRPLESHGDFILSDRGLFWRQRSAPEAIVIADGERLVQQIGDNEPEISDDASNPMVLPFSRIFLGIFSGDEESLREHFDIAFDTNEDTWEIALTPTSEPLSLAIESIILRGRGYIEELTVLNRSADQTVITFSDIQTQPEQLTDHEIELYAR